MINHTPIRYDAIGVKQWGEPVCLLDDAVDLTANTSWTNIGFGIESLFEENQYSIFKDKTKQLLLNLWKRASFDVPPGFKLDQYHMLARTREQHLAAVEHTKLIDVKDFPVPVKILEERISAACKKNLVVKNPWDGQSVFHFRVIRPQQTDNNPLHRDVWLEDYDNCINLYIPIAGSNEKSSLILIPGSHRWSESRIEKTVGGAEIKGVKFNVPAVTAIEGPVEFVRPNPQENEVLIFSPYLVHGGAINLNSDTTRISIEIRLWER